MPIVRNASGNITSVAQDYQNYPNNREAINALIAAKHERRRVSGAHPRAGRELG